MLYQLPNGKVIRLSLEEYLSIDDKDLHYIVNSGHGEDPSYNSYFNDKSKMDTSNSQEEEEEIDDTPDYEPDI